jgi:hypothetical protein
MVWTSCQLIVGAGESSSLKGSGFKISIAGLFVTSSMLKFEDPLIPKTYWEMELIISLSVRSDGERGGQVGVAVIREEDRNSCEANRRSDLFSRRHVFYYNVNVFVWFAKSKCYIVGCTI